jgi:hypothetical protein
MAPSIPTHRPLLTANRVAVSIAVAACASSLYLAFGSAWAVTGLPAPDARATASCPVASIDPESARMTPGVRDEAAAVQ